MNKKILGPKEINLLLEKMTEAFFNDHQAAFKMKSVGIVGIQTRGVALAKRISEILKRRYHVQVHVGLLDITLYRDDVGEIGNQPLIKETDIPFPIDDKIILLVDDVLYTGRTIRAALDALLEQGRPTAVRLAVGIDRGERELPIRADYCGIEMPVKKKEKVQIKMKEIDGSDGVWLVSRTDKNLKKPLA
jgi:pyrimidine operon attenuation protein / uracil phosphoribosyltransferase